MTMTMCYTYVDGPLGPLFLQGDGQFLTGLYMTQHKHWGGPNASFRQSDASFTLAREQLAEYFAGERVEFDLPLKLAGTPFQQRVWQELTQIPCGATISYAQLAERVGKPTATRAVGHANGRNPISIIVPCHRVIGANGKLTGYGGGVDKKQWLLDWERRVTGAEPKSLFDASDVLLADNSARQTRRIATHSGK